MEQLIKAMKSHDWFYDYSDDISVYRAGKASEQELYRLYVSLGSPKAIWNEHCPEQFRK